MQRTMRASLGPLVLFRGFTNRYVYVVPTRVLGGAGVPSFTLTGSLFPSLFQLFYSVPMRKFGGDGGI